MEKDKKAFIDATKKAVQFSENKFLGIKPLRGLTNAIDEQLYEISAKREQIKHDYIKAWLAVNVPDKDLNPDWLINNVRIIEKRTQGDSPLTFNYSWELAFKGNERCEINPDGFHRKECRDCGAV